MTGNDRPWRGRRPAGRSSGALSGPPWAFDDLADLHAGLLTDDVSNDFHRRISDDAEAQRVLAALDTTCAELHSLPKATMPADIAARLDAALAEEEMRRAARAARKDPAAVTAADGLAAARRRRARKLGWGAGLLAAAAVAVGFAVLALPEAGESGLPLAEPSQAPPPTHADTPPGELAPLTLSTANLGAAVSQVAHLTDYGPIQSPDRLDACLKAVGVASPGKPLGVRQVTLRDSPADPGRDGVLVVLPAGVIGSFRLVVVGPECGPANPDKLADTTIPAGIPAG